MGCSIGTSKVSPTDPDPFSNHSTAGFQRSETDEKSIKDVSEYQRETLNSMVPRNLLSLIQYHESLDEVKNGSHQYLGVVLIIEISGLAELTQHFATKSCSGSGADEMQESINFLISKFITELSKRGGDIQYFVADQILALFRVPKKKNLHQNIKSVMSRATKCGRYIQENLDQLSQETSVNMKLYAGVGTGKVVETVMGSDENRWRSIVWGNSLLDLSENVNSSSLDTNIISFSKKDDIQEIFKKENAQEINLKSSKSSKNNSNLSTESLNLLVEPYLKSIIRNGLVQYLSEIRMVTTVSIRYFIKMDLLVEQLNELKTVFLKTQQVMNQYEGFMIDVISDSKGFIVFLCFGHPYQHDDDVSRAIEFSITLLSLIDFDEVGNWKNKISIGISTDKLFMGTIGIQSRMEFSAIGPSIEKAKIIMENSSFGEILCDSNTALFASRVNCGKASQIRHNGKISDVFKPSSLSLVRTESLRSVESNNSPNQFIGREKQYNILKKAIKNWHERYENGIYMVHGAMGSGKYKLIRSLLKSHAIISDCQIIEGFALKLEKMTAFYVFKNIFRSIAVSAVMRAYSSPLNYIDQDVHLDKEIIKVSLNEIFISPSDRPYLALINSAFEVDFAESQETKDLDFATKQSIANRIILNILWKWSRSSNYALLLVLYDIHWADEMSINLLKQIALKPRIAKFLLICTKTNQVPPSKDLKTVEAGFTNLYIKPFNITETNNFLSEMFQINTVDNGVLEYIYSKAKGNQFITSELTWILIRYGLTTYQSGTLKFTERGVVALKDLYLPTTISGIYKSKISNLSSTVTLTAKIASILGMNFTFNSIIQAYPSVIHVEEDYIFEHIEILCDSSIIQTIAKENNPDEGDSETRSSMSMFPTKDIHQQFGFTNAAIQTILYDSCGLKLKIHVHKNFIRYLLKLKNLQYRDFSLSSVARQYIGIIQAQGINSTQVRFLKEAIPYILQASDYFWSISDFYNSSVFQKEALDLMQQVYQITTKSKEQTKLANNITDQLYHYKKVLHRIVPFTDQNLLECVKLAIGFCSENHSLLFDLKSNLFLMHFMSDKNDEIHSIAAELYGLIKTTTNRLLYHIIHSMYKYSLGRLKEAAYHADTALEIYNEDSNVYRKNILEQIEFAEPGLLISLYGSKAEWLMGNFEKSEKYFELAEKVNEETKHSPSKHLFIVYGCNYYWLRRDFENVEKLAMFGMRTAGLNPGPMSYWPQIYLGCTFSERGYYKLGLEMIEKFKELTDRWESDAPIINCMQLECILKIIQNTIKSEEFEETEYYIDQGLEIVSNSLNTNETVLTGELFRIQAMILIYKRIFSDEDSAQIRYKQQLLQSFKQSLDHSERIHSNMFKLRTSISIAFFHIMEWRDLYHRSQTKEENIKRTEIEEGERQASEMKLRLEEQYAKIPQEYKTIPDVKLAKKFIEHIVNIFQQIGSKVL